MSPTPNNPFSSGYSPADQPKDTPDFTKAELAQAWLDDLRSGTSQSSMTLGYLGIRVELAGSAQSAPLEGTTLSPRQIADEVAAGYGDVPLHPGGNFIIPPPPPGTKLGIPNPSPSRRTHVKGVDGKIANYKYTDEKGNELS